MAFKNESSVKCLFCGEHMRLQYKGVFHTFKPDHGPFDIYYCDDCGSCQTDPLPAPETLEKLYNSYNDGLPELHRKITADDPQIALYQKCIKRICHLSRIQSQEEFTWADIGSGGGELSALMATQFPNSRGTAIDLHSRPHLLTNVSTVEWNQIDINQDEFSNQLPQFNLVISIAVLEHVLRPDKFISNLLKLVRPGGMLYLLCPNNASWASRLLRQRWPYFTPGEHLAIPSPAGAVRCLEREWQLLQKNELVDIHAQALMLPYTFRYVLRRLGADMIGKMLPLGWSLPLPAGALEASVLWK